MDSDSPAKASLQIGANSLKIEGGEEFVERLVEKLGVIGLVGQMNFVPSDSNSNQEVSDDPTGGGAQFLPAPDSISGPFVDLDEVYAPTDEGFAIIADAEENTIAKTARNYILLHMYGCYLIDRLEVSDDDIRSVCITHACYDPGNFAHHVKGLGSKVIRSGGSRSYQLKLTAPGIRAAKQFALDVQKRAIGS